MYIKITETNINRVELGASIANFPLEGIPQNTFDITPSQNVQFYTNQKRDGFGYLSLLPDLKIVEGHLLNVPLTMLNKMKAEMIIEQTWWYENVAEGD